MKHVLKHVLCLSVFGLTQSEAANFNWNVAGPADWNNAANWLPDGGADNDRFVNNGGIATITADTTLVIRDTKVGFGGGTSGTVNHSAGIHANGPGNWTFIGLAGGNGTYNMADTSAGGGTYTGFGLGTGSHTNAGRLYVGDGAGSIGKFNMNTTGTMHLGSDLIVGINGGSNGTFNMDAGTVSSAGWTFVGQDGGTGTMRISGGLLTANNRMYVGANNGNGTLIVSGGQIDTPEMHIADNTDWAGAGGTANVTISGGIINTANQFQVGRLGAVGTVNQSNGQVNVNGGWFGIANDHAGSAGSSYALSGGQLNLNNGVNAEIGADTVGSMTVSGTGKLNGSGTVHVGLRNGGVGTLTISGNGEVNAANGVSIGTNGGATGTIQGNGGTIFAPTIGRGAGGAQFNANGVTFKARSNQAEFLPGLDTTTVELQAGGLKVDTNGFNTATGVALDGVGGLTKQGLGTLTLNGASTYSGITTVSQGILALGPLGSLNPSSVVDVALGATFDGSAVAGGIVIPSGQTLKGNGSAVATVTTIAPGGILAPGNSIGTLTFSGALTLNGTTNMEIDRTGLPISDEANATGTIDYGGILNVSLLSAPSTLQLGDNFDLFDAPSFFDVFTTINLPSLAGLGSGDWYWSTDLPNNHPYNLLDNNGSIQVLPEPSSAIFAGLAALSFLSRRRRA